MKEEMLDNPYYLVENEIDKNSNPWEIDFH